jgi:hypothetical protein
MPHSRGGLAADELRLSRHCPSTPLLTVLRASSLLTALRASSLPAVLRASSLLTVLRAPPLVTVLHAPLLSSSHGDEEGCVWAD